MQYCVKKKKKKKKKPYIHICISFFLFLTMQNIKYLYSSIVFHEESK